MFSDYDSGTGYDGAKLAIRYIENISSQTLNYAYLPKLNPGPGYGPGSHGTLSAGLNGQVDSGDSNPITSGNIATDLLNLGIAGGFDSSSLSNKSVTL